MPGADKFADMSNQKAVHFAERQDHTNEKAHKKNWTNVDKIYSMAPSCFSSCN